MTWWKRLIPVRSAPASQAGSSLLSQNPSVAAIGQSLQDSAQLMEQLQIQLDQRSAWLREMTRRLMDPEEPPTETEIHQAEIDLIAMQRELGDASK